MMMMMMMIMRTVSGADDDLYFKVFNEVMKRIMLKIPCLSKYIHGHDDDDDGECLQHDFDLLHQSLVICSNDNCGHLQAELDPVPRYGLKLVQGAPRYSKTPTRDHWHLNICQKFKIQSKKKKSKVG